MLPAFRQQQYGEGLLEATTQVIARVAAEGEGASGRKKAASKGAKA